MWDELPVPTPQAVIDHEAHIRRVIEEQNKQAVDVYRPNSIPSLWPWD